MPRRPKVERIIDDYGLEGWGERLETAWTGGEASLRDLADRLNRELLASAMADAGINPAPGEVSGNYRALTSPEATAGERTTAEASLREMGIDVDDVRSDFVTHQAVHTYLRKYREAEAPTDHRDPERVARERLDRLASRHRAVVVDAVEGLGRSTDLDVGDVRAIVSVSVVCEDCGGQYDLGTLLDRGGCDCSER